MVIRTTIFKFNMLLSTQKSEISHLITSSAFASPMSCNALFLRWSQQHSDDSFLCYLLLVPIFPCELIRKYEDVFCAGAAFICALARTLLVLRNFTKAKILCAFITNKFSHGNDKDSALFSILCSELTHIKIYYY